MKKREMKILPIILKYLPKKNRGKIIEEYKYYIKQFNYWKTEKNIKFIFEDDIILLLLQVSILYKYIIIPLFFSKEFYEKFEAKKKLKKIKIGNIVLDNKSIEEINQVIKEFMGIIYSLFEQYNLNVNLLGFEEIEDFFKAITGNPENEI